MPGDEPSRPVADDEDSDDARECCSIIYRGLFIIMLSLSKHQCFVAAVPSRQAGVRVVIARVELHDADVE